MAASAAAVQLESTVMVDAVPAAVKPVQKRKKNERKEAAVMDYDVIIIGAGPGGIFSAYELVKQNPNLRIAMFELGNPLEERKCPIAEKKAKACIHC